MFYANFYEGVGSKMMNITKIKDDIYWVGAIDWNLRDFHGYTTNRGSTYGAYLIIDEKVTLLDTVKSQFSQELLDRVSEIIEPEKIDYLVSNHVEMDHSGSIPEVMKHIPNASIVTISPSGLNGLKAHYGDSYNYIPVKTGDTLNIGKRNLQFIATPMLHWPDNMVTYCPEEKILFSNDAFGQHYASNKHFDDETDINAVMYEARKYYANILMPFGTQIKKALGVIEQLDIDIIAPSHGIMWRSYVKDIISLYHVWCDEPNPKEAVIVYDTMWHSTEIVAKHLVEYFSNKGISVKFHNLKQTHMSDILVDVVTAKYILVGSPTINNNMMPTVAGFLSYLRGLTAKNKVGIAFGSYGWGGQSVGQVSDGLKACGYEMPFDIFRFLFIPKKEDIENMIKTIDEKID